MLLGKIKDFVVEHTINEYKKCKILKIINLIYNETN